MTSTVLPYEPVERSARAAGARGRFTLLALLCAIAAIAYVQRSAIAVPQREIGADLRIDKALFGNVFFAWYMGYALMQIPSGWLADRWGSRRALAFYAVLWSLATGVVALSRGYFSLVAMWALMGVAQAGIFPCSVKAISRWFAQDRRASATGLLGAFMGVGGAVAPLLTALLLTAFDWRWVFVLYVAPGVAWAALFYAIARDAPPPPPDGEIVAADAVAPVDDGDAPVWRALLGSGSMWLLCAQQFLRAAAMIFFVTWFPTYLRDARGATIVQSGMLTTLAGVGAVAGSLLGGFCSDKILAKTGNARLSRQGVAVAGMTACALLICVAYFVQNTTLAVAVISAGAFCGTFGGVSGYTVAMDFGGRRVATVFSMMNMCGNIGAALFPLVVGWMVQAMGSWDAVLFIFAGIFAVDAVCWAMLNPKRPLFAGG